MSGHVRQRGKKGQWYAVIDVFVDGKRKRNWEKLENCNGKKEAEKACERLVAKRDGGTYVRPSRMTVAEFLAGWLDHMQGQVSPRTHETYADLCRRHLVPLLGGETLVKLRPDQIREAYAKALASGRRDGQGGLSARYVTHMHRVLREALQQAFDDNVLARNPADAVRPPKVERKEVRVVNVDGAIELTERARGTRLFMPIFLAVRCGMRRQEIAALRWRNVHWRDGFISVVAATEQTSLGVREKETKSGKGRRAIVLSATEIEELRAHRARQAEELLGLGVRLTDDHHVVAREDGQPLQPRSLSHAMRKFARRHGVPVRLHGLRHSHGTHMLGSNVHPKIAQERLGHSSVGITLDLYSHVLPGMQAEAMSKVDAALRDALDRRSQEKKW